MRPGQTGADRDPRHRTWSAADVPADPGGVARLRPVGGAPRTVGNARTAGSAFPVLRAQGRRQVPCRRPPFPPYPPILELWLPFYPNAPALLQTTPRSTPRVQSMV